MWIFAWLTCCLLLCSGFVSAQTVRPRPDSISADKSSNSDDRPPLTTLEEELRAKQAIKFAEKEHQENLSRAKEIAEIGKALREAVRNTPLPSRDCYKKIERLEKLTRKIRGEAGGEDQEVEILNRPSDVPSAITQIAEVAESLSKDVQNTPRQVVSASVIGSANVLLELIKMMRALGRQP
jgi:hypothetical protein